MRWEKLYGKRIIGHGRETRIVWDGDGRSPPVMFHSNGVTSGVLFEGSLDADIYTHVGDSAALRCTSVGSKRFLHGGGQMFVMQDCHVDGWKSTKGAVQRQVAAPLTLFDCISKCRRPGTISTTRG